MDVQQRFMTGDLQGPPLDAWSWTRQDAEERRWEEAEQIVVLVRSANKLGN